MSNINEHGQLSLHSVIHETVIDRIMMDATDTFGDKRHSEAYKVFKMYDIFIMHDCHGVVDRSYVIDNLSTFLEKDKSSYFKPSYSTILFLMNRILQFEDATVSDLIDLKYTFDLKMHYGTKYREFLSKCIQMFMEQISEYRNFRVNSHE